MQEELHHARTLGLSVALGAAMGAALGAATGHMGVWVATGIASYIAISLIGGVWSGRPIDKRDDKRERITMK
jgi:HAMP domain-containing protein